MQALHLRQGGKLRLATQSSVAADALRIWLTAADPQEGPSSDACENGVFVIEGTRQGGALPALMVMTEYRSAASVSGYYRVPGQVQYLSDFV